jgi:ankyrin repeat protein
VADSSVWQEYLVAGSARINHPAYHIDEQAAHMEVALLCMCYIGIYLEQSRRSGSYEVPPQGTRRTWIRIDDSAIAARSITYHGSPLPSSQLHSLDEYVLSWGFRHLAHTNPRNRAILHAIKILHSNAQRHHLEWDQFQRRSNGRWPTLQDDFVLFILIAFAPTPLLRSFIGNAQLKCKDGTNPLIYAACFGEVEHARILLSSGVSLNRRGYLDHHQLLPLEAAVRRYDLRMVNLFLTEGSPVPHELFMRVLERYCDIPARIVSRLVQTDEFVEWAPDARDEGLLLRALDPMRYAVPNMFRPSQQDMDIIQQRFVQIGCDPSTRFDETSLRHAVSAGHVSTVQRMLSRNTSFPPDIILDASRSTMSNAEMICLCLDMGSDVHTISSTEDTPLHLTLTSFHRHSDSEADCSESVRVLIDAGCNPSTSNLTGETSLHLAVGMGFISIAKYLLVLHHVPLPPDILLAASESHKSSMIRFLTSKGADVHAIAANGDTPLHRVLRKSWADSEENLDCIKVLINSGCNPCLPNALGKTPFDVAAENGHLPVVQYLHSILNSPFSPDILLSVSGSISSGTTPVIKFLIAKGAGLHVTNPSGDTLLHLAMLVGWETECLKRIKFLVNAGCDPHARNLAGETPFHIAAREGYIMVMEYLLSLGISVPSDVMCTQLEREGLRSHHSVRFLLDKGGDVHTVTKNGNTLLHLTANIYPEEEALELAKHLVHAAGCIPGALNSLQETPLHIAAQSGYTSVIKYLLSLDIELPPDILLTASLAPGYSDRVSLIRYLVQEDASVSVSTTDGDTPLHLLLVPGSDEDDHLDCAKILIEAGCDPRAQNVAGETPLHRAARYGYTRILEYLLSQLEGVPLPHDILLASETPTTLRFFLGKGLDLRSVSAVGVTDLMHRALDSDFHRDNDTVEFARILVGAGWDPALKNSAGETAIHAAARNGDIAALKFFLSQNVRLPSDILLAAVSPPSDVPPGVHFRHIFRVVPLTRFLVREGASVKVTASNGNTPLHLAMMGNFIPQYVTERLQWELVEILLDGSDPYARNVGGQTPYDLAEAKGHFFKENFLRLVRNSHGHRLHS